MNSTALSTAVVGLLLSVGPSSAQKAGTRELPLWPHQVVAELQLTGPDATETPQFLAAQLDGAGGQELITVSTPPGATSPSGVRKLARLRAYRLEGRRFRQIAEGEIPLNFTGPAAGDLDGDGRDELYGINPRGELLTIRRQGARFVVTGTSRPSPWTAADLVVSDVRQPGHPELVVAYDKDAREPDADPDCDWLIAFRPDGQHWKAAWRERVRQTHFNFRLFAGAYGPGKGPRLVCAHLPSDVSTSEYEVMDWSHGRLTRQARPRSDSEREMGLQMWKGVGAQLTAAPVSIVSSAVFLSAGGSSAKSRNELLEWSGNTLRARYRFAGDPVAVGQFQRAGISGILVQRAAGRFELQVRK